MPGFRTLKGATQNFLGTFTSRNCDYNGYWLFGLIEDQLGKLDIDLLEAGGKSSRKGLIEFSAELARTRFREQLAKAGMVTPRIREATLRVARSPSPTRGFVNGHRSDGHDFTFSVRVVSHHGKAFERQITIFVAPHNPFFERRSRRRTTWSGWLRIFLRWFLPFASATPAETIS